MKKNIVVIALALFVFTALIGCNNSTNTSDSTISVEPSSTISQTEKKDNSETEPTTNSSPFETTVAFTPPETTMASPKSSSDFLILDSEKFIDAFHTQTTNYDMCTWSEKSTFDSSGKHFESYTLENILGNAYIATSCKDNGSLSDISLICNRGTMVYYYAVSVLISIDENIDYEKIVKSLGITETDEEEPGLHVLQAEGMDIVFERKEDRCVLNIMFYR